MKTSSDKIRLRLCVEIDESDKKAASWYADATVLIKQLYGENWKLFVGLLASTSPRVAVKKNWQLADSLLTAYLNRDKKPKKWAAIISDLMPSHLLNVIRVLQGRPIKGPKVRRFYENLTGNLSDVTIDVWICKAFGIEHGKLTPRLYKRLEQKIRKQAENAGLYPAEYQAVLWYAVRRLSGVKPKSFVLVYQSISCETPWFAFMQDEDE